MKIILTDETILKIAKIEPAELIRGAEKTVFSDGIKQFGKCHYALMRDDTPYIIVNGVEDLAGADYHAVGENGDAIFYELCAPKPEDYAKGVSLGYGTEKYVAVLKEKA